MNALWSNAPRLERSRRARRRGFTLVELSVALVGGLVVGLAVVGLSREATNTFHEETRAAAAEMSLRSAVERIRADLARASYMSSPNIWGDPTLALNFDLGPSAPAMVQRLAGIQLYDQGSLKKSNVPGSTMAGTDESAGLSGANGLAPDAIDITGNLTSTEVYSVGSTISGGAGSGGACAAGDRLVLNALNPPVYRLGGLTAAAGAELARQFTPVSGRTFLARVVDPQGRVQYANVCNAGFAGGALFVDIVGSLLQASSSTQGTNTSAEGGVAGFGGFNINPVVTVRYKIAPTQPPYDTQLATGTNKYDLYRIYVDSTNAEVGTPELIAEYAVDLKFAFTVDSTTQTGVACNDPTRFCPPYPASRTFTSLVFGDTANPSSAWTPGGAARNPGPQRIRSVRVRLATRTALADRTVNLASPTPGYLFRYCMTPTGTCTSWARVRTVVTEVALNNQAQAVYP